MTRLIGSLTLFAALALTLAGQDSPKGDGRGKDNPPAKDAVKKDANDVKDGKEVEVAPAPEAAPAENPDEIIKRLKKNFNTTEERLDAKDPSDATSKLQEQIIED